MRKLKLFVVFCAASLALHSQIAPSKRVLLNEKMESDNFNFGNFVDENGVIYYKERKKDGFYLCKANSKFENILSVKTDLIKVQGEELIPFRFLIKENKLFLISYVFIKRKSTLLYVQSFNKETLKALQDPLKIAEVDYKKTPLPFMPFNIYLSPDKSKALFSSNNLVGLAPFKEDYNFIFDLNNAKNIAQCYPKFESEGNLCKKEAVIDNAGGTYILIGKVENDYENQVKYRLGRFTIENKYEEVDINLEGKKISSLKLSLNKNGSIEVNGFFSKESYWKADGIFTIGYDKGTIIQKEVKEYLFEEELIFKHLSESEIKDLKKIKSKGKSIGVDYLVMKNIFEQSDGTKIVIAEQYNSTSKPNSNGQGALPQGSMTSLANYIFVCYFSPDGQLIKTVKINKKQSSDGGKYVKMSFYSTLVNDDLYFLYNDFIENVTNEGSHAYKEYDPYKKGAAMILMILEKSGKLSKEIILDEKSSKFEYLPNSTIKMSDNNLFIFSSSENYTNYVLLKL